MKRVFLSLSFLVPLFFYLKTLLPTVGLWDIGEMQTVPYTLDIAHPTGFPTYILLGKMFLSIFPFGSVAWRMNFFSSLLVSLGCVFLAAILYKLTKDYFLSLFGVLFFGFNKFSWEIAIRADVHSLHLFFTLLLLFLMLKILLDKKIKLIPITAFVLGVALGNHLLTIFALPLYFLTLFFVWDYWKTDFIKLAIFSLFLFLLGLSVYWLLLIIAIVKPPLTIDYNVASWEGFSRLVGGKDFQPLMKSWTKGNFFDSFIYYFGILKKSFFVCGLVFVIIGFVVSFRKCFRFNILLFLLFFLTIGFGLRYQNAALERYFISSLMISTFWLVIGLEFLKFYFGKKIKLILRVPQFPFGFLKWFIIFFLFSLIGLEIQMNYKQIDQSKNFSAYNFAQETFGNISPNGTIISWWSLSTPLWYLQMVEGERADIKIYNIGKSDWEKKVEEEIERRPVFLIEELNFKNPNFGLKKVGNIYRVVKTEK